MQWFCKVISSVASIVGQAVGRCNTGKLGRYTGCSIIVFIYSTAPTTSKSLQSPLNHYSNRPFALKQPSPGHNCILSPANYILGPVSYCCHHNSTTVISTAISQSQSSFLPGHSHNSRWQSYNSTLAISTVHSQHGTSTAKPPIIGSGMFTTVTAASTTALQSHRLNNISFTPTARVTTSTSTSSLLRCCGTQLFFKEPSEFNFRPRCSIL